MINPHHQEAQALAAEAELVAQRGDSQRARELYSLAADLEQKAVAVTDIKTPRTFSILALSTVALLYKAGRLDEAELLSFRFLANPALQKPFYVQLRELLDRASDDKAIAALGYQYSKYQFQVSLRGGDVGVGSAPLDIVVDKYSQFNALTWRAAEFVGKYKLRTAGPPPAAVQELVQARASLPTSGSYRFVMKLTEPLEPKLFPDSLDIDAVASLLTEVVRMTAEGESERLKVMVPDAGYRQTFIKLTRNFLPSGKRLREIDIASVRDEAMVTHLRLTSEMKPIVRSVLRAEEEVSTVAETREVHGVLRAVDLDGKWLRIDLKERPDVRCNTKGRLLDDVVGPMVNKRVIARVQISSSAEMNLVDMELDDDQ